MPILMQIGIEVNCNSTGKIAEQLGDIAMSHGWESYIAYARGYNPSKSKVIKIGNYLGIFNHLIQTRLFDNHGFASTIATKKLIQQIKIVKPDIIQLHQLHGYFLNIKVLFEYFATINTPIVWSLHDCWSMTGHCAHFALIGCEKWKTQCFKCPQKNTYPKSLLVDRSRINYTEKRKLFTSAKNMTIVPTSLWVEGLTKESYLQNLPITMITNGVDTQVFVPQSNKFEVKTKYNIHGEFMILGVGTEWNENKGLYDYYELQKKLPENYSIVLVGVSKNQLKKLPKGIIGIARTENVSELVKLYSAADVITSLSYLETFGLTPVEGFACGTPAIVYNCTASPELIVPGVGFVVEPGNIDEIVSAIDKIKSKGKESFTAACRELALKFYNKKERYSEYIKLYNRLLQKQ